MTVAQGSPLARPRIECALLAGLAPGKPLFHLPVLNRYGYHHDEPYFIACGEHVSFGYVDHAPRVPWIARLATTVFGESLRGLRIVSTLEVDARVELANVNPGQRELLVTLCRRPWAPLHDIRAKNRPW